MSNIKLIETRNAYLAELEKPASLLNMWRLWRLEKKLDNLILTNKK